MQFHAFDISEQELDGRELCGIIDPMIRRPSHAFSTAFRKLLGRSPVVTDTSKYFGTNRASHFRCIRLLPACLLPASGWGLA